MKRFISIMLVLLMLAASLAACVGKSDDPQESEESSQESEEGREESSSTTVEDTTPEIKPDGTFYPINDTASWFKRLDPRMEATAEYLTCDWSAAGIEFVADCSGDIYFEVNVSTKKGGGKEGCYFRAYVDGSEHLNGNSPYYEAIEDADTGKSYIVLRGISDGEHKIRLVKATGYTLANVNLIGLTLCGTVAKTAPADNELLIEFVGDSISCGWGVVGEYGGAYTDQDATLAYPYMVANALGADWSIVALSGQGVIKGNPGIANGYKFASPFRSTAEEYGFERGADVVVVNVDTNDAYENYAEDVYKAALDKLVKYIREKNGADTHIILVCNMMKQEYSELIRLYVKELGGAANNYYYYKGSTAKGVNSDHPTAEENTVYAAELCDMINKILAGGYTQNLDVTYPENCETVYYQSFDNVSSPTEAGIGSLYGGGLVNGMTISNSGELYVPVTPWGKYDCFAELVSNDVMKTVSGKYIIEMDLNITNLHVLSIVFNSENNGMTWGENRRQGHSVSIRSKKDDLSGGYLKGYLSSDKSLVFSTGYFNVTDRVALADKLAYDIPDGSTSADFRLSIMVDGNRVDLFVDGKWMYGYNVPNDVDLSLKKRSSVILWAEDSELTIDNLSILVESDKAPEPPTLYALNNTASWLKKLDPRMEATADYITCDWSASGIEFVADCKGTIEFKVNATTFANSGVQGCYFKVYIDGKEYYEGGNPYFAVDGEGLITVKGIPSGRHTIKLVKATGYTLANTELISLSLSGSIVNTAPADNELFIEFIGDSMSCGWGVIGNYGGAYTDQDATLAFPYLIASKLGADYSVLGLSGKGLLHGTPNIVNAYKYSSINRSTAVEYGFERAADVVVINADTNDAYNSKSVENYINALKGLIAYIRQKQGNDVHIILVCNMMRSDYTGEIRDLVAELGGASNKYYYYKAKTAAGVHSAHPTAQEDEVYANELSAIISAILDGSYVEPDLSDPSFPTGFTTVYEQSFDSVTTPVGAGISQLYGGSLVNNMTISGGVLNIPKTAWNNNDDEIIPDVYATLIGNEAMRGVHQRYLYEMDVTLTELGVLGLIFNTNGMADRGANHSNSIFVTLRRGDYQHGAITGTANVNIRAGYINADGKNQTVLKDGLVYDVAEGRTDAAFRLSVLIDGHSVDIFVDGVWVQSFEIPATVACDLKAESTVVLWAENASATIDNIKISTDTSSEAPVDNKKLPVTGTTVYEQSFDGVSSPASGGVSSVYGGGLNMSVSDGKLSVGATGWDLAATQGSPDCFAQLVGSSALSGVGNQYIVEMDMTISQLGVLGFILNGDNDSTNHKTSADYASDRQNALLVTLRGSSNPSDYSFVSGAVSSENDIYFRTGYFNALGDQNASNKVFAYDTTGDTASFKLSIVVRDGRVDLFIDGEWIYGYDAPSDIDCSKKENSAVLLWAQDTVLTIDNLKVISFN